MADGKVAPGFRFPHHTLHPYIEAAQSRGYGSIFPFARSYFSPLSSERGGSGTCHSQGISALFRRLSRDPEVHRLACYGLRL